VGFLLTAKQRFRKQSQAPLRRGTRAPGQTLKRNGTKRERLVVEQRTLNRGTGAKQIRCIINVDGVPVDRESLKL
jgi:hypothetical protein